MSIRKKLDQTLYPNHQNNWDDLLFRERILSVMGSEMSCLDYGAGRGNVKQLDFRGHASFIAGVDPDEAVFENPYLNEAKILDLETQKIDYPDSVFDVIYADNVFEHVTGPTKTLSELKRVLKPGGQLLIKTPNVWHYMPIFARLSPSWFHRFYNSLRGREVVDTFPTKYEFNSKTIVKKLAKEVGLEVKQVETIEGRPEYLRIFWPLYLLGTCYERIVNSSSLFEGLRCVLYIHLQKPMDD